MLFFPLEKVDILTDNEDIDEDHVYSQGLPNDVCGYIQIQTNRADADLANDDIDSIEESSSSSKTYQPSANVPDESSDADEKEKKVIGSLKKTGNEKNKVTTWKITLPKRKQLLETINSKSKTVKDSKNAILEELAGKHHVKLLRSMSTQNFIVTETNRYIAQKNTNSTLIVTNLETFNAVLILTEYHSLPRTKMFCAKEKDTGLSTVYESIARKQFEDIKRYINFTDNNQLDTKNKFVEVRKLYEIMSKTCNNLISSILTIP